MVNFSNRVCTIASLTALFGLAAASQVSAQIVFDGGAPDPTSGDGNEMTHWIQTAPFTLAAPTTLTGVHFWDIEDAGAFTGTIHWQVYSNSAGSPGVVVSQGDAITVSHVATGNAPSGFTEFANDFSISGPSLAAGSFWLGLHNGALSQQNRLGMYWETNLPNTGIGKELQAPFTGSFASNGNGHAFYLTGSNAVPEPGNLALVIGSGVTGSVFLLGRRLRRKK